MWGVLPWPAAGNGCLTHVAAANGWALALTWMLDNGADVDAVTTRTEETATDMATSAGHDAVVARLSEAGADH